MHAVTRPLERPACGNPGASPALRGGRWVEKPNGHVSRILGGSSSKSAVSGRRSGAKDRDITLQMKGTRSFDLRRASSLALTLPFPVHYLLSTNCCGGCVNESREYRWRHCCI